VGLSLCRERLDYMHVCVCVWRTGDVSECRESCLWRKPTGRRCVRGKLSVLCVKVLRVSWEFWRKSQAHGVCVEGEMGLCRERVIVYGGSVWIMSGGRDECVCVEGDVWVCICRETWFCVFRD